MKWIKIKKILISLLVWLGLSFSFAQPSFNQTQEWISSVAYDPNAVQIKSDTDLKSNIITLFFPGWNNNDGWIIYDYLKNIWIAVIVIYLIIIGANLLFNPDKEKDVQKNLKSFWMIAFWIILFFGANWLVNTVWDFTTTDATVDSTWENLTNRVLKVVIVFLKNLTYFAAIAMVIYYGYRMIVSSSMDDKVKAARTWVLNVAIALVFIRVIDYLYYIATQNSFKNDMSNFVVQATKVVWWLLWVVMVIMVIYSGIQLITSRWDEAVYKKSISTIRNIFIVGLLIMVFLLIIYQVFSNLG